MKFFVFSGWFDIDITISIIPVSGLIFSHNVSNDVHKLPENFNTQLTYIIFNQFLNEFIHFIPMKFCYMHFHVNFSPANKITVFTYVLCKLV